MSKKFALILTSGLLVAACGSSSNHDSSSASTRNGANAYSHALAFSKCMRAHGLTNFPDPNTSGGGISINGVNPQAPAFHAAQTACRHLLPFGGPTSGHPSAQEMAHLRQVSECMRAHGISSFPDPTTSAPPDPSAYSAVFGQNGGFLAIPNSINPQSPAFERAAAACNFGPR